MKTRSLARRAGLPVGLALVLAGVAPVAISAPTRDVSSLASARPAKVLFVSPLGSDSAPGTLLAPLRTVGKALDLAKGGQRIRIAPGIYPPFTYDRARNRPVRLAGYGLGTARIQGAVLAGAQGLVIRDLHFTSPIRILDHAQRGHRQPSGRIRLEQLEIAAADDHCLSVREGSFRIRLERSYIHDCRNAVSGPPSPEGKRSRNIVIVRNLLERLRGDGIQFSDWNDVEIRGNTIRHMDDPRNLIHNDGVQVNGRARRIRIVSNRIYDSAGQLVLIGGGAIDRFGPIRNVLVENNLIHGAGAWAVQNLAHNARFRYNTIWDTFYGALVLPRHAPDDSVVVGNILDQFELGEGTKTGRRDFNLIRATRTRPSRHDIVGKPPRFRDHSRGDYRLKRSSPARRAGPAHGGPKRDLAGRRRPNHPSLGALEFSR